LIDIVDANMTDRLKIHISKKTSNSVNSPIASNSSNSVSNSPIASNSNSLDGSECPVINPVKASSNDTSDKRTVPSPSLYSKFRRSTDSNENKIINDSIDSGTDSINKTWSDVNTSQSPSIHSNGLVQYSDGSTYKGKLLDNKKNGYGIFTTNTFTYKGEFINDEMNGYGKAVYLDGSIYEGDWKNGLKCGEGILVFANGDVYDGLVELYYYYYYYHF